MSSPKKRTPCFVAGCVVVAAVFIVTVIMLAVLFLHIPSAEDLYTRMKAQPSMTAVYQTAEEDADFSALSEQSRNIYQSLQTQYTGSHVQADAPDGMPFACLSVVEYYSDADGTDDYLYGMLIYTDSISTAYDVFTTYYRIAGEQGVDFSETDYFLFVRGQAVFVGNRRAFLKAYMHNLF